MGEQIPTARGTMIALALTSGSIGRLIADFTGSALVMDAGFQVAAGVSAIAALATVVVFVKWVQEKGTERLRG